MIRKTWLLVFLLGLLQAQEKISANTWLGRYFGRPTKVFFTSKSKALLVDSKGFASLDTVSGSLDYITSETIFNSGMVNGQLVLFNREQKKLYFMNPQTGGLLLDKRLQGSNLINVVTRDNAIYYVYGHQVVREKQDEEVRLDFEGRTIVKVTFDESSGKLLALVEEPESNGVCVFSVDEDLHKMERKNCFSAPADVAKDAKRVDVFSAGNEVIMVYDKFALLPSGERITYSVNEDVELGQTYQETLKAFLSLVNLQGDVKAVQRYLEADSLCVKSSDASSKKIVQKICKTKGSWAKLQVEQVNGATIELDFQNVSEQPQDFFVDAATRRLLITTEKDTLICFDLNSRQQLWKREEGLAGLANVLFVQNPHDTQSYNFITEYDRLLANRQWLKAWHLRLNQSLRDFFHFTKGLKDSSVAFVKSLLSGNVNAVVKSITGGSLKLGQADQDSGEAEFKTNKTAFFISKNGKIFAFDLERLVFTGSFNLTYKVQQHAKEKELPRLPSFAAETCGVFKHDVFHVRVECGNQNKEVFLLDHKLARSVIPPAELKASAEAQPSKYGFSYDAGQSRLLGLYNGSSVWSIQLPATHSVVALQRIQDFKIPRFAHVIENKNVLYRVVDPNNALLVTKGPAGYLFSVVNLKFGKVIYEIANDKVSGDHRLNFLVDDGSFIINYFNTESLQNELLHIEIFRKRVENDFLQILKTLFSFSAREQFLREIDYSQTIPEYSVTQKRYALPFTVKSFLAFDSKSDLTSKNLIIITESDQVYSLSRALISTRRIFESERPKVEEQLGKPNKSKIPVNTYFKSLTLPPYDYHIPLDPKRFVSRDLVVVGADKLWVEPSNFESTSIVVCAGKELFLAPHAPDNKFDQLPDDFSKAKLWGLFALFAIAIVVSNRVVKNKRPMEKYLANN